MVSNSEQEAILWSRRNLFISFEKLKYYLSALTILKLSRSDEKLSRSIEIFSYSLNKKKKEKIFHTSKRELKNISLLKTRY